MERKGRITAIACQIFQLAQQTHTQMMGYVISTSEALIIIDGGTTGDAAYLWHLLKKLGGDKPRIDAWFLTHPHLDHVNAFMELIKTHGRDMSLRGVYLRFPSRELLRRGEPGCVHTFDEYEALRPRLQEREHLLNERERLSIGDTRWEVLYVADPAFVKNTSNNSSAVLRLTAEGKTVLFLGDLGVEGGKKLFSVYGSALKSDIVQMAHHGQSAVLMNVYDAIHPEICLWCAPKWLWDNNQGNRGYDSGMWDVLKVKAHMKALGVQKNAAAKDGTMLLTLKDGRAALRCYDPYAAQ